MNIGRRLKLEQREDWITQWTSLRRCSRFPNNNNNMQSLVQDQYLDLDLVVVAAPVARCRTLLRLPTRRTSTDRSLTSTRFDLWFPLFLQNQPWKSGFTFVRNTGAMNYNGHEYSCDDKDGFHPPNVIGLLSSQVEGNDSCT